MGLYKYIHEKRIDLLTDGLIRFTQPQAFNDPFELKPYINKLANDDFLKETINENLDSIIAEQYAKIAPQFNYSIPLSDVKSLENVQPVTTLDGVQRLMQQQRPTIENAFHSALENNIGIFCLTENPDNLLMWAHYANSHKGLVIEFDENHSFFNQQKSNKDEIRHLIKVDYRKERPHLELTKLGKIGDLSVKSKEWEYEQEWRMMLPLIKADKIIDQERCNIHLFKIPLTAIKSLRIGCRATKETLTSIINTISINNDLAHIKAYQVEVDNKEFKLNTIKINI